MPETRQDAAAAAQEKIERMRTFELRMQMDIGRIKRLCTYFTFLQSGDAEFDLDDCISRRDQLEQSFRGYVSIVELYYQLVGSAEPLDSYLEVEELYDKASSISHRFRRQHDLSNSTMAGAGTSRVVQDSSNNQPVQEPLQETRTIVNPPIVGADRAYHSISGLAHDNDRSIQSSTRVHDRSLGANSSFISHKVKLPPLTIPHFTGDPKNWQSFYELFSAVMDAEGSDLSQVQKLYYLRAHVRDEPLNLIDDLPLINDSYAVAIKTLKDRYENKLSVIRLLIRKILDLPSVSQPSAATYRNISVTVKKSLGALKAMTLPVEHWDMIILEVLTQKLDYSCRRTFETEHCVSSTFPKLDDLLEFLSKRALILENLATPTPSKSLPFKPQRFTSHVTAQFDNPQDPNQRKCPACMQARCIRLFQCKRFQNMNVKQRRQLVSQEKRCFNCLSHSHAVPDCGSTFKCSKCGQPHHSMLHVEPIYNSQESSEKVVNCATCCTHKIVPGPPLQNLDMVPEASTVDSLVEELTSFASHHHKVPSSQILLGTAEVSVQSHGSKSILGRALLDSASQTNFVTKEFVDRLGFTVITRPVEVMSLSCQKTTIAGYVNLKISSQYTTFNAVIECAVVSTITTNMPQSPIDEEAIKIPCHFFLADRQFSTPAPVQLLLGAEVFIAVISGEFCGTLSCGPRLPTLLNTRLGWVVTGPAPIKTSELPGNHTSSFISANLHIAADEIFNSQLEKFWKLEEVDSQFVSTEGSTEQKFLNSLVRIDNKFQVDLLFKSPSALDGLGNSYPMALKRFYMLERRFQANPELYKDYKQFIDEYISLGHATKINFKYDPSKTAEVNGYFLPHHPVIKESSTTTRLRVVFDASAVTLTGVSLNDTQLAGTPVQASLFEILLRFRKHRYVFSTDVEKMYRQFLISPKHRKYQRILWREKPSLPLIHLELKTITYGVTSAPYSATRILKYIGDTNIDQFPMAVEALRECTYVDDILSGHNDLEQAKLLQHQLITLLKNQGLHLRKWCANHPDLLSDIAHEDIEDISMDLNEEYSKKTLGLVWNPRADLFCIAVPGNSSGAEVFSKRTMLSYIMSVFDPLGLIAPVVFKAKLFMQEVWAMDCAWDTVLPEPFSKRWKTFIEGIPNLTSLKIPRWILSDSQFAVLEVHGFCDASMKGFGACIYIRACDGQSVQTRLVCSKSKVAPMKELTLPRLELEGAVLLSRLYQKVRLLVPIHQRVYLYSDSQITLHRLGIESRRLEPVVAHRIATIHALTPDCIWMHIGSKDNPADPLSRGLDPESLIGMDLWWHGPALLKEASYPIFRPVALTNLVNFHHSDLLSLLPLSDFWMDIFKRVSSLMRLKRIIAYMFRFLDQLASKNSITSFLLILVIW